MATAVELARDTAIAAIHTPRLIIRAWHNRFDRRLACKWPSDPNPYLPLWSVQAPETTDTPRMSFAVVHREQSALAGRLTLRDISRTSARIGIYLAPNFRAAGIGTEAMMHLLYNAFEVFNMRCIHIDVAADNSVARRCYAKLGFCPSGAEWRNLPATDLQLGGMYYRPALTGGWQGMFLDYQMRV